MSDKKIGRPSVAGVGHTPPLAVRFTPAQRLYLERVADSRGIRLSEVVREVVEDHREKTDDDE